MYSRYIQLKCTYVRMYTYIKDDRKISILKKGNRDQKWEVCKQIRDQKSMETS